ncbi:unnamed protein product, partial [Protopolystoma xenopodis]
SICLWLQRTSAISSIPSSTPTIQPASGSGLSRHSLKDLETSFQTTKNCYPADPDLDAPEMVISGSPMSPSAHGDDDTDDLLDSQDNYRLVVVSNDTGVGDTVKMTAITSSKASSPLASCEDGSCSSLGDLTLEANAALLRLEYSTPGDAKGRLSELSADLVARNAIPQLPHHNQKGLASLRLPSTDRDTKPTRSVRRHSICPTAKPRLLPTQVPQEAQGSISAES